MAVQQRRDQQEGAGEEDWCVRVAVEEVLLQKALYFYFPTGVAGAARQSLFCLEEEGAVQRLQTAAALAEEGEVRQSLFCREEVGAVLLQRKEGGVALRLMMMRGEEGEGLPLLLAEVREGRRSWSSLEEGEEDRLTTRAEGAGYLSEAGEGAAARMR